MQYSDGFWGTSWVVNFKNTEQIRTKENIENHNNREMGNYKMDKIEPSRKCWDCKHLLSVNDDNFYIDAWHYYCDAIQTSEYCYGLEYQRGTCIDGFAYETNLKCKYYNEAP